MMMRIIETPLLYWQVLQLCHVAAGVFASLRRVDGQGVQVSRQLPALVVGQSRPGWHAVGQASIGQQPMQFAVSRVVYPGSPQTGTPADTQRIVSMAGGTTPFEENGPSGDRVH